MSKLITGLIFAGAVAFAATPALAHADMEKHHKGHHHKHMMKAEMPEVEVVKAEAPEVEMKEEAPEMKMMHKWHKKHHMHEMEDEAKM